MSRVKVAFACRRNDSSGEEFAHHLKLADCAKFIACSVEGFAHRGSCFRSKRATFCGRIDWHCATPSSPATQLERRAMEVSQAQCRLYPQPCHPLCAVGILLLSEPD